MSPRTRTPWCSTCDRYFRYGPIVSRCPQCDGLVVPRTVQFERTCQAMPQDSSDMRRAGQARRHAGAKA